MDTSEDELCSTIDPFPAIAVYRYRLTKIFCTSPLYITHTALPILTFAIRSTIRGVSLVSPERRDNV